MEAVWFRTSGLWGGERNLFEVCFYQRKKHGFPPWSRLDYTNRRGVSSLGLLPFQTHTVQRHKSDLCVSSSSQAALGSLLPPVAAEQNTPTATPLKQIHICDIFTRVCSLFTRVCWIFTRVCSPPSSKGRRSWWAEPIGCCEVRNNKVLMLSSAPWWLRTWMTVKRKKRPTPGETCFLFWALGRIKYKYVVVVVVFVLDSVHFNLLLCQWGRLCVQTGFYKESAQQKEWTASCWRRCCASSRSFLFFFFFSFFIFMCCCFPVVGRKINTDRTLHLGTFTTFPHKTRCSGN